MTFTKTILAGVVSLGMVSAYGQGDGDTRHHGYEHGYRDGFAYGRDARVKGTTPSTESDAYRNADHGYRAEFGMKQEFETGYREGYRQGSDDGFANQNERFEKMYGEQASGAEPNERWGGYDVASEIGYRDGAKSGLKDAKHKHSFRPTEHDQWKDGDRGYHGSFGSKEAYKAAYRKGYEVGYRDGFGPAR